MRGLRLKFMVRLYEKSSKLYASVFKRKKEAWGVSKEQFLANYPVGTLGYALGVFYQDNDFDIMPKLENHDVFHVLTETGTTGHDEVALQYLLLGNGKVSLYLLGVISLGLILFPEYALYYWRSFRKGIQLHKFYDIDFKPLLMESVEELKETIACQIIRITTIK